MSVFIVIIDKTENPWRVLDKDFEECPTDKVFYDDIYDMDPVEILNECDPVEIESNATGAESHGTPIEIEE
ncbi:hypothetical protein FNH22_24355 [Fulvivirga sp. M361]|uniref:hypothetical protein n=1 Tax=Fulvivirga sp. M361 TaxID=2594266 RepID=UPI0011798DC2|nr:hypothetical protein [Fulvivirga sp. M361]TRX51271.1 hypothetical protein FNH22_24355 [Fulvivirga sp. M361]